MLRPTFFPPENKEVVHVADSDSDSDFFIPQKQREYFPKGIWRRDVMTPARNESTDNESEPAIKEEKLLVRTFKLPELAPFSDIDMDLEMVSEVKGPAKKKGEGCSKRSDRSKDIVATFDKHISHLAEKVDGSFLANKTGSLDETDVDEEVPIFKRFQPRISLKPLKRRSSSLPRAFSGDSADEKKEPKKAAVDEDDDMIELNLADEDDTTIGGSPTKSNEKGSEVSKQHVAEIESLRAEVKGLQEAIKTQHVETFNKIETILRGMKSEIQSSVVTQSEAAQKSEATLFERVASEVKTNQEKLLEDIKDCRTFIRAFYKKVKSKASKEKDATTAAAAAAAATAAPLALAPAADADVVMAESEPFTSLKRKLDDVHDDVLHDINHLATNLEQAEKRIRLSIESRADIAKPKRISSFGLLKSLLWTLSSMVLGGALTVGIISRM
ncbi:hypothetical protein HDU96_002871 [Phlyctochytrium bullatum]|nr:hypothetical protein HDU96_002871 [Phlyctochytrium bullatum]